MTEEESVSEDTRIKEKELGTTVPTTVKVESSNKKFFVQYIIPQKSQGEKNTLNSTKQTIRVAGRTSWSWLSSAGL